MDQLNVRDCHVHCYPDAVIADPVGWAKQQGEPHWEHLVTNGPQGWAGPEDLLRAMDRDGIEQVLLQAWYWEKPESCRLQNEWHAEWISRHPGRFKACAAIHPDMADPVGDLESARQWGAVAVGECLPQVQARQGWEHPAWESILNWTSGAGWLMAIHVTEPVGHAYPGRIETPLWQLVDLFEQHPEQRWLCAHWGGGLPFHAMNKRVRNALANVWFDSAASPLLYDSRIWKVACATVGAGKILFGSDFPLFLYPSRSQEPGWSWLIEELRGSGLEAEDLQAVCSGNWEQVINGTDGK
jgi:predicted TIM-barrel fold metal-dependent hydrolase